MQTFLRVVAPSALVGFLVVLVGCGSSGGGAPEPPGNGPVVQSQATGGITPGTGGTVQTPTLRIDFPAGAVNGPMNVVLQGLSLDAYRDALPGLAGQLVKVCRVRPEYFRLKNGQEATLSFTSAGYRPGAQVSVYRQEVNPVPVGQAALSGTDTYSVAIDRLGVYFWVLESNFCLRFDGVDDCVRVPHSDAIKFGTNDPFTIECWFRTTEWETGNCDYRSLVSSWGGGGEGIPYPYELRLWLGSCWADGYLEFASYDGELVDACSQADQASLYVAGPYNDGHWHHFAAVRDGTQAMRILIDGHVAGSRTPNPALGSIYNDRPIAIGGTPITWHTFEGSIDEVRIWNMARTRFQIRDSMRRRLHGTEGGLVGLWNFDEGGGRIAADATANGDDGTLLSDPQWVEATWPATS